MIQSTELKIFIEETPSFMKRVKRELHDIDSGKAAMLRHNSISFQTVDQFRSFLTPKRLELLRAIRHLQPDSIYALAKMLGRTPENVNTDLKFLKKLGFVKLKKVKDTRDKVQPEVAYDGLSLEIAV